MDDKELSARLNYSKAAALASMVCLQQLVRVIQERKVLATVDLQDAIGEALAAIQTDTPSNEDDAMVAELAVRFIHQTFADDK